MSQPPSKFVDDQHFCVLTQFALATTAVVLSALSVNVPHDGSSDVPYFICGFILAALHALMIILRIVVLTSLGRKGVPTKKKILDTFLEVRCVDLLWKVFCSHGFAWGITGVVLCALGGVSCDKEKNKEGEELSGANATSSCYYDIYKEKGDQYKGLAIGLLVVHVFSSVWFFFSFFTYSHYAKELVDPKPQPQPKPQPKPAADANPAPKPKQPAGSDSTKKAGLEQLSAKKADLEQLERRLNDREQAIQQRELGLNERENALWTVHLNNIQGGPPPPPRYEQLAIVEE
ncbi:uncharacterized protein LOC128233551 [Mya arenaria]|uniref:uncharacterized protein LOC128233551 n=1 Tax=Mya arenaria TaxID=6604 RepID=UPI0022E3C033|nr:uncharacterized protein LOC128233551 [Mya arenaria]